jgi:type II secretory pathway component GspD/PulD (secretin)
MKTLVKLFFAIFISTLIISCAAVRQPIAINKKPTLTQAEIKNLEQSEDSMAEAKYQLLLNEQKNDFTNQPRITSNYVDADVRSLLTLDLFSATGINIIPDNTVEGSITVSFNNTPLEKALEMILYPGGYQFRYIPDGNYYIVGKALPENDSFGTLTATKTIKTNRGADKILSQLSPYYQTFVRADGQTITITATPDIINRLERDISLIDKSKRLVEISAQFVMVEWEKGTNLGVQWSDLDLSALGIGDFIKGGANAMSLNLTSSLTAFLSSNGYDTKIRTIAEPRIVVEDGEKAEINITEEHLFLILSGGGAAYNYFTTKDVSVGTKLKVQPFVARDGQIRLVVKPEVADIVGEREFKSNGGPTQKLPIIARRSTETTLKVQNGETVAIGGLITKNEKTKKSGIPFFRKIPIIGFIFGSKDESKKETELVIFLSPKIIG